MTTSAFQNKPSSRFALGFERFTNSDTPALLFIGLCWIIAIILVNPIGEFPSVDDWSYVSAVRVLVERGEIKFSDSTATNLISQVFWGAFFALPFGVSYTALRISTLVARSLARLRFTGLFVMRIGRFHGAPGGAFADVQSHLLRALFHLHDGRALRRDADWGDALSDGGFALGVAIDVRLGGCSRSSRSSAAKPALPSLSRMAGAYLVKHGLRAKAVAISVLPVVTFVGVQYAYQYWLSAPGTNAGSEKHIAYS